MISFILRFQFARLLGIFSVVVIMVCRGLPNEVEAAGLEVRTGRVLVVANRVFPESIEIANSYMRARNLPPANLVLISVDNPIEVDAQIFQQAIMEPVKRRLEKIGRAVDYIVITRGVPYRADNKSTTAALMFGGLDKVREHQGFFEQERYFDAAIPVFGTVMRPATGLITYNVRDALALIERSLVRYDSPDQPGRFYFCHGAGPRGVRNEQISQAMQMMKRRQARVAEVSNHEIRHRDDVMAQFTGARRVHVRTNTYLPGSVLDNVTSYGGYLLEETNQTSVTTFIQHGVCGTYGTVVEPTNIPTRWARLSLPARYVAGFNLIDVYLQTIIDLSLGIVVGDPLMAPYARPPVISLDWSPASDPEVAGTLEFDIAEGVEKQGISWLRIWLNDEVDVGTIVPQLPAGAKISCSFRVGGEEVYQVEQELSESLPLPQVLARFARRASADEPFEIFPVGRYGGQLLIRVGPAMLGFGERASAELTVEKGGEKYSRKLPLGSLPVMGRVGMIDLSGGDAMPEDTILFSMADEAVIVRAPRRMPASAMAQLVKERLLERHPAFGADGQWQVMIPSHYSPEQVWIVNREITSGQEAEVGVSIQRMPGSSFAPNSRDGGISWTRAPVAAVAESVVEPYLPTAVMNYRIALPREVAAAGFNRIHVAAGTPAGASDYATLDFELAKDEIGGVDFQMAKDLFSLGETMNIQLDVPDALAGVNARLLLNGRQISDSPTEGNEISVKLKMPEVSPGIHEIWVEWFEDEEDPEDSAAGLLTRSGHVLARTGRREIRVRRPLQAGTDLESKKLISSAGGKLKLQGPYLHEGVEVQVAEHSKALERDPRFGLRWTAELPPLPTGEYEIRLTGDSEKDQDGVLSTLLQVVEKEND